MNEEEIAYELIEIAKNQAGASLYLKLLHVQGVFDEPQTSLGLTLNYMFSELTQDLYIEVIKERGRKSIIEVIHHFLQLGIEVE